MITPHDKALAAIAARAAKGEFRELEASMTANQTILDGQVEIIDPAGDLAKLTYTPAVAAPRNDAGGLSPHDSGSRMNQSLELTPQPMAVAI